LAAEDGSLTDLITDVDEALRLLEEFGWLPIVAARSWTARAHLH
jgi:hypothetical protein